MDGSFNDIRTNFLIACVVLIRCRDCVSSTIDSYSCPHCFESAPLTEAKNKKNRCNHCFQCPQCTSTLSTYSIMVPSEVLGDQSPKKEHSTPQVQIQTPSTPPQPRGSASPGSARTPIGLKSPGGTKLYYLSCTHCKWTTRDVGIRDKRSPMDFKERPSPHQERISELVTFYKEFALRDKAEREKARKTGRRVRSYGSLLDTSKFSAAMKAQGPESPTPPRRASSQITWDPTLPERIAAKSGDPAPPPEHLYSTPFKLEEVPTLKQRFLDPMRQPASSSGFCPRPLHLVGKKLHRCKGCDHILLKAEINPSSIRFKIQQIALHTFPQVRILEYPNLESGQPCEVLISINNPVNYSVTVMFEECSADFLKRIKDNLSPVDLPVGEFFLAANDDVGDLLDGDTESEIEDNPKFVHTRSPGKLVLKFSVTPENVSEDTKFMFVLKFTHKSTVEIDKQNEVLTVGIPVLVNVGRVSKSS